MYNCLEKHTFSKTEPKKQCALTFSSFNFFYQLASLCITVRRQLFAKTVKRRSFIPVTKLTGLVGYWYGLYYNQTRAFQKVIATKLGAGSGSAETMAAPLLPDVVIRDRMKASKGNVKVVEQYLGILVRSIVQFKYVPRIYLFGLLCGLYPEEGWGYAPSAGLIFVAAIRQVIRDAPSFDVAAMSKANTVWVADSTFNN